MPARAGVPAVHVGRHPGEPRADYDARLADVVAGFGPDFVVLAGWMRILTMSFLGWFPDRVVNLHPALPGELPGTHAIERAWHEALAGERTATGVMVHLVPDEGVDDGPVLGTATVPIHPDDTLESLTARVHRAEHELLVDHPRHPLPTGGPSMTSPNDELFDRFEALTFDDVVIVPGYSETLPDTVDTAATFAARHHARRPARVGGDGQGHRVAHGDRHGPPGRHRRDPPQPDDRRPGRRGAEGQAQPERDDHRPGDAAADGARCTRPRR